MGLGLTVVGRGKVGSHRPWAKVRLGVPRYLCDNQY
jgi:hypothetical protein